MINGKIHYKWPFSIAMLNNQRVNLVFGWLGWTPLRFRQNFLDIPETELFEVFQHHRPAEGIVFLEVKSLVIFCVQHVSFGRCMIFFCRNQTHVKKQKIQEIDGYLTLGAAWCAGSRSSGRTASTAASIGSCSRFISSPSVAPLWSIISLSLSWPEKWEDWKQQRKRDWTRKTWDSATLGLETCRLAARDSFCLFNFGSSHFDESTLGHVALIYTEIGLGGGTSSNVSTFCVVVPQYLWKSIWWEGLVPFLCFNRFFVGTWWEGVCYLVRNHILSHCHQSEKLTIA